MAAKGNNKQGGQKNILARISTAKKGGDKKPFVAAKGGRGNKFRRGGKGGQGDRPKKEKTERDPAKRQEELDKELESYWVKGGHTELKEKRLDDDLDNYFKKATEPVAEAVEGEVAAVAMEEDAAKE